MSDDSDWEPFRVGDDLYDPRTGRYRYREKGRFARAPFPDYLPDYIGEYERATAEPVVDEEEDAGESWSPWIPISSSRCKAVRFDYSESRLLMSWTNGKIAWAYSGVDSLTFDDFVKSESKGKFVNSVLNSYSHSPITGSDMKYFAGHDEYVGV
jgi:hypothetical protein